jgi:hypothetical protein
MTDMDEASNIPSWASQLLEEVFSTNFIIGNFKLMLKLKKSFG